MSVLIIDDLESYALNQDPFGGFLDIGFFKGKITSDVLNRNTGTRVYQMGLNGQLLHQGLGASIVDTTMYWLGVNTPSVFIGQSVTIGDPGVNFAWFQVESDRTVSLYINSTFGHPGVPYLLGNSVSQLTHTDVWQDYQLDIHMDAALVITGTGTATATRTVATVTSHVWVEGTLVISAGPISTDLDIGSLPAASNHISNWQFSGNGYIDNLWITDSLGGAAVFPFIGTGVNPTKARVTQGAIETVKRVDRSARVTQGAVETIKLPPRAARVTQGVVEIIKRGNTGGWQIYEA